MNNDIETIGQKPEQRKPEPHVHHDWMDAEKRNRAVPMDARSSPFVQIINGVEHRVMQPYFLSNNTIVSAPPPVPVDPRLRPAHIKWENENIFND
jgi:hypothetical protein